MSRSRRKTPIFGNASHSEAKDKKIANRMFRKRTRNKIAMEQFEQLPLKLDDVLNVWAMAKDGKGYWRDGKTRDGGRFMRKQKLFETLEQRSLTLV